MQVSLPSTIGIGPPTDRSSLLLLPDLLTLLGSDIQALREQREEEQLQRREDRHRQVLAAGGVGLPSPAELAAEAERKMAPGSRAARDQMRTDVRQQQAFQRTLADATGRSGRSPGPSPREAAQPAPEPTSKPARDGNQGASRGAAGARPAGSVDATRSDGTAGVARAAAGGPASPASPNPAAGPGAEALPAGATAARGPVGMASTARAVEVITRVPGASSTGSAAASVGEAPASAAKPSAGPVVAASAASDRAHKPAATTTSTAGAKSADTGKADANIERILRFVRTQLGPDRTRATLRLDPPELGNVRLRMDLHRDVLLLRIDTQTPLAHRLLSEQIESLRDRLEAAGIQLERVEIRPPTAADAPSPDLPPEPDARQAGRDGSADADAEHPPDQGTESTPVEPAERSAHEMIPEPVAESLVNILA